MQEATNLTARKYTQKISQNANKDRNRQIQSHWTKQNVLFNDSTPNTGGALGALKRRPQVIHNRHSWAHATPHNHLNGTL
jgi:hypothetical protein